MTDPLVVRIAHSIEHLLEHKPRVLFTKTNAVFFALIGIFFLLLKHIVEQISTLHELKHEYDMVLAIEVVNESNNIIVSQSLQTVDLFTDKL